MTASSSGKPAPSPRCGCCSCSCCSGPGTRLPAVCLLCGAVSSRHEAYQDRLMLLQASR
ncbi:hypothetical protein VULLAG_LOCUS9349 [Vulpes lagopus]